MPKVMELTNVSKQYKGIKAVNNVSFSVEAGHIVGLIGPNGAGKTTIMKMLGGLAPIDEGTISLFGNSENLDENRDRISFMIEAPLLDGGISARNNMEYIRYLRGVADRKRIDEVLEIVGLADVGKKKVKKFSLGMKQRLGIAMALLPDPEVFVLDEPVNGLDPEGIVEVRQLLEALSRDHKKTIIISSHLLSELWELCTDFLFLNHGTLIESISKEELALKSRDYIAIKTDNIPQTAKLLEETCNIHDYKCLHNDEIQVYERLDELAGISKCITKAGYTILKLNEERESLEDYYLSLVEVEHE